MGDWNGVDGVPVVVGDVVGESGVFVCDYGGVFIWLDR